VLVFAFRTGDLIVSVTIRRLAAVHSDGYTTEFCRAEGSVKHRNDGASILSSDARPFAEPNRAVKIPVYLCTEDAWRLQTIDLPASAFF
jgi:hypothetical protein